MDDIRFDARSTALRARGMMILLGAAFVGLGAVFVTAFLGTRSYPFVPAWVRLFFLSLVICLSLLPGAAYLVLTPFVAKERGWAVISALSLSIAHAALCGAVAIALAMRGQVGFPVIGAAATLLLIVLAMLLIRTLYALRLELREGFEPILPPQPVIPAENGE